MASSRIFIKGLPPTFTDVEFRKHFSQNREITDAKIFPNRRIGYIGYKTPEDAQKAVKYFNKTFIRMSRIGVELARPPAEGQPRIGDGSERPTARRESLEKDKPEGQKKRRLSAGEVAEKQDPKLKEFLEVMRPKSKKRAWEDDVAKATEEATVQEGNTTINVAATEDQSDDEYENVPRQTKKLKKDAAPAEETDRPAETQPTDDNEQDGDNEVTEATAGGTQSQQPALSDADWARSRTSRLLGLLDDDEGGTVGEAQQDREDSSSDDGAEVQKGESKSAPVEDPASSMPTPPSDTNEIDAIFKTLDGDTDAVRSSMRLFVRNLPYDVKNEDLQAAFERFGHLEEVHIPLDTKSGAVKGFAYVQFSDPDAAQTAMLEKDGQTFQGRLLHVLPANKKRETQLDDFELSKLPLKKQQQIKRKREAASTTFNWNALYMNADAVVSSVANKLGLSKSEVLDPTSSDAAIKQAHAETHIIQETKAYFKEHGVDLDAFKKSQRGDTAILVKNIPYDCSRDELKRVFEEHGELKKFLMPPSETLAVVEFANAAHCKAAFGALAYRKLKGSVLFLEKAPKGLFDGKPGGTEVDGVVQGLTKTSASDLKDTDVNIPSTVATSTIFVRNLNFSTTTAQLGETFESFDGFLSGRVKTKTDPKKPGQILSMGFGFLEFRTAQQAQRVLGMDGYVLDGHKLQLRASHKGADAAESRRVADAQKRASARKTKIIIKNLPFEASKKDVRALFSAYGQLRSVRVPKKMDRAARGFAFADFTTPKEAESAMEALRDTHLLGRRLVLEFAEEEAKDAEEEIERMQSKVGKQVNKVALQKVMGGGQRRKFRGEAEQEEG